MAAKTSPITPAVLGWSIAQDGRPGDEIADAARIDRRQLYAWIEGTERPSVGELSELARVLHRPRAFFFLPVPPTEAALPSGFRHPPGADKTVSSAVLVEARRARRLQLAIASLVDDDKAPALPSATMAEAPATVAAAVRCWLNIGESETWADDRIALRRWRTALEDAGVLVFELQLGKDAVRGFALYNERAPMVVANTSGVSPAARTYTVGHELAHLVLRDATACIEPSGGALAVDDRKERWCERFAAALLMPVEVVRLLMRERGVEAGQAGIDEVKAVMNRFRCSARAAAARLDDLGFADEGLYPAVLAIFKAKPRKDGGTPRNPPRFKMRLRQYGVGAVGTVLSRLPESDALSILRIDAEDARRIADEVPGVAGAF